MITSAKYDSVLRCVMACALMLAFTAAPRNAWGQTDSISSSQQGKAIPVIGFDVKTAYVFPSFRDDILRETLSMDNAVTVRSATSLHLNYGFQYPPSSEAARLYPGVVQGAGAAVTLFEHRSAVGTPISLYLFQGAPVIRLSDRLSLDYVWNFGVSAGWSTCDGLTAQSTVITGSKVNAYIDLGIGLRWRLNHNYSISAGLALTHYSNGNTTFPNPGVNMAGLKIGLTRDFGRPTDATPFLRDTASSKPHVSFDLTAYGAWRKRVYRGGENPLLLDGHFGVAGISFAPMWDIRRYFRAGISADFQWDKSSDLKRHYISGTTAGDIRFSHIPFFSQVSAGASARAELVMPLFSVNVGIGYNFIGPTEARASYQMANLKIYMTSPLYLNIGYQLQNFHRQNNLMLGLGYTFGSTRHQSTTLLH